MHYIYFVKQQCKSEIQNDRQMDRPLLRPTIYKNKASTTIWNKCQLNLEQKADSISKSSHKYFSNWEKFEESLRLIKQELWQTIDQ